MSVRIRQCFLLFLSLTVLAMLAACGPSNNVRLLYNPSSTSVLPQPQAPRVAVVMFEDQRPHQMIGERKDGSVFTSTSTVADWISRSLADELARQGIQVSYAGTLAQAQAGNPDYIVTGTITDVWLKENSATNVTATIRAMVNLANRKGIIYSENLTASQDKQFIPSSTAVESVLADTLRDLLVPAAKKLQAKIQ